MQTTGTPMVWTIGHSSRDLDSFVGLLAEHDIRLVADVRRFAGSRRHPQFGQDNLRGHLAQAGVEYRHFVELGGRRSRRQPNSPNTAWRVESFNAYADHMQTPEFRQALEELEAAARERRTAIMCAEALPWRCHRRLIADALIARGWTVLDILAPGRCDEHPLPEFGRVENGQITYPGATLS